MKNKFSSIDFDELEEGQFIVIEQSVITKSELMSRSYILSKVKSKVENKTKIDEIGKSDRIHLDAIETSFYLENYITKKTLSKKNGAIKINSRPSLCLFQVTNMWLIETETIKRMAIETAKKKKKEIKKIQKEEIEFNKTMQDLGLLPTPRTKK